MTDTPLLERTLGDGSPAFFSSGKAYGEARGVTRAAVSKWKKAGHLVFVKDPATGRDVIDAAASDARRAGNQDPAQAQAGEGVPVPTEGASEPVAQPHGREAYSKLRAARESYRIRNEKLDWEERVGALVSSADVEKTWGKLAGRLSAALLMLPASVAKQANPSDPRVARQAIDEAVRKLLERFAADFFGELADEAAEEDEFLERQDA